MFLIVLISVVAVLTVIYFRNTFNYWEKMGIPSYPSPSLIYGHMRNNLSNQVMEMYKSFKSKGLKHGGFYFFHQPIYMPIDPDLLKQILTKDFEHFTGKGLYNNEKHQPLNMHLFQIGGERWKKLRVKLTPTFTSGKLKNMFPTMVKCATPLVDQVVEYTKNGTDLDIKDIASKFTTDVIGSCAFGLDCNSFADANSDFHSFGKKLLLPTKTAQLKQALGMSFPNLCRFLGMVFIPKDIEQFYTNITKDNLEYRQEKQIKRNDFLQLLMELQHKDNPNDCISTQDIINQSFVFYVAGYETSSSVMTFALLELSRNADIQDKVRAEIFDVLEKHNNEITYDSMHDMKYLGQVIDETLRMYPPVVILNRECTKQYKIPGTDATLAAGTKVFIPVMPIQYDAEHYPEPTVFDPDRFSDENKKLRHQYAFLPFGEGPRQCIGLRFGLMQTKIGLVTLLRQFKFALHPSVKYPIQFGDAFLAFASVDKILLKSSLL